MSAAAIAGGRRRRAPANPRIGIERQRLAALRTELARQDERRQQLSAEIVAIEARQDARGRARAMTTAAARTLSYRDGTPKDSAAHREVARRYAWGAHKTQKSLKIEPGKTGEARLMALLRLRELERLFSQRYGAELPDDDAGRDDLVIAAHHIAHIGADAARHIVAWAQLWAPWMTADKAAKLADRVIANPFKFTADVLAWRLHLTQAERHDLGITTIGAIDSSKGQRAQFRKLKRQLAASVRRRERGGTSRALYEGNSLSRTRPWEALGVSRRTWYRRGKPPADAVSSGSAARTDRGTSPRPADKDSALVVTHLCHTPPRPGASGSPSTGVNARSGTPYAPKRGRPARTNTCPGHGLSDDAPTSLDAKRRSAETAAVPNLHAAKAGAAKPARPPRCSHCRELMRRGAVICRHCLHYTPPPTPPPPAPAAKPDVDKRPSAAAIRRRKARAKARANWEPW
jgi:hypothetical protein